MTTLEKLQEQITSLYQGFWKDMGVDSDTKLMHRNGSHRFASDPYIGTKYADAKLKVLFVGRDIGMDDGFYNFDARHKSVTGLALNKKNPHIAGTYVTALYFLREAYSWQSAIKEIMDSGMAWQSALKHIKNLPEDVLDYVALTNLYKFVLTGSDKMSVTHNMRFDPECRNLMNLLAAELRGITKELFFLTKQASRN